MIILTRSFCKCCGQLLQNASRSIGCAYASGRHVVKHCVSPIEQNYSPEHFLIKFPTNDEYYEGVLMPILAGIKNKQLRSFASKSARLPASPLVCQQVRSSVSQSVRLYSSPLCCKKLPYYTSHSPLVQPKHV
jgi:hypothetical protein